MTEQPNYYAIIPANVRYDKRLRANEKLLYAEITALSNKTGICWASNTYFAELYGVSKVSISNWINDLVKYNYIDSQMIYKENSKEIDRRVLKICSIPVKENFGTPIKENFATPIKENFKENNTRINNTSINKKHSANEFARRALEHEFDDLWAKYPNKKGKQQAFNHYKAWKKKSTSNTSEYMSKKLDDYIAYCTKNNRWYHAMNGSTWFNGRFEDELKEENIYEDPWSIHYE